MMARRDILRGTRTQLVEVVFPHQNDAQRRLGPRKNGPMRGSAAWIPAVKNIGRGIAQNRPKRPGSPRRRTTDEEVWFWEVSSISAISETSRQERVTIISAGRCIWPTLIERRVDEDTLFGSVACSRLESRSIRIATSAPFPGGGAVRCCAGLDSPIRPPKQEKLWRLMKSLSSFVTALFSILSQLWDDKFSLCYQ